MSHIVVFAVHCLLFVQAQYTDPPFSSGCFFNSDRMEELKYICKSDPLIPCPQEREECLEESKVETIKYECERKSNYVKLHLDELRKFMNLNVLDISSLGILFIVFDQNTPFSVNQTGFENQISILKATHNKLQMMSCEILNKLPKIAQIDLSHNQIQYFDSSKFNMCNEIAIINCSYNKIKYITDGEFGNLGKLEVLDLSHNAIESIAENAFVNESFTTESQLSVLNLSNNPLTDFDFEVFSSLHNLEVLDLGNTPIQKINEGCFKNNPKMKKFILEGTLLEEFSFNIFSPQASAVEVCLPSNNIKELDISCLDTICHFKQFCKEDFFENIRSFKAAGNYDQNISKLLEKIGMNVEMLDLSQNSINILTDNMLQRFFHLRHLNFSHSKMSKIENSAFVSQLELISLDGSYNNLEDIDDVIFQTEWTLETLNLTGNRLKKLDNVIPRHLPKLKSLKVSKNQLVSQCLAEFEKVWKFTNVKIETDDGNDIGTEDTDIQSITTEDNTDVIATSLTIEISSPAPDSTTNQAVSTTIMIETNESENGKLDLSVNLHISSDTMYIIIGVLIVITITVVAIIIYFCRKKRAPPAGIPLSSISINVTTPMQEPPYEEIKDPLPSAYAVTTLNHMLPENAPSSTMTFDRYQDAHHYNASLQSNEYADIYHHYSTVSKPKTKSHSGSIA